ncbi:MAG: glycosyltransferase [Rhodospirillaceae bacterium]|nr:MAG: glycosyltransferase [Rhodospirillaceae bacterium]
MKLSIVTTLYCSAPYIEEFYRRIVAAAEQITDEFEIIFVNDGSPDDSLEMTVRLHERDSRVVIVDLSRNFGHHKAMMTGLAYANGELIFLIDSDLEEQPELLRLFHQHFSDNTCDVVYGVQRARRGGYLERLSGSFFYWLVKKVCHIDLPKNVVTVRIMSRRYVKSLLQHRDREMFIAALWFETGYRQIPVAIDKATVKPTSYTFGKKLRMSIDFVTAHSSNLLYYVFYLGLFISFLSFCCLAFFILRYFVTGQILAGWTSIIASIWMFGGLFVLLIGLVGIYIARIFTEVKQHPYTIIRDIYSSQETPREGQKTGANDA